MKQKIKGSRKAGRKSRKVDGEHAKSLENLCALCVKQKIKGSRKAGKKTQSEQRKLRILGALCENLCALCVTLLRKAVESPAFDYLSLLLTAGMVWLVYWVLKKGDWKADERRDVKGIWQGIGDASIRD